MTISADSMKAILAMVVVGGDGPCNRERLGARVKAPEDGAWVRDAALAHASKQAERSRKQA